MKGFSCTSVALAIFAGLLLGIGTASAQATRTWVSGVGDDVNPCSRTAPCKTFAGAISKTANDGEINCIDPGGFGAVTIVKSIVIDCGGTFGSTLNAGTYGIIVNAGAGGRVILRNLSINGAGTGINGIHVLSAAKVHIENVAIRGQSNIGINFTPSGNSVMTISGSNIRDNGLHGIYVKPSAGMTARLFVANSQVAGNGSAGIRVDDGTTATVSDTAIFNNGSNGVTAASAGGVAEILLERVVTSGNASGGVLANGPAAAVRMSNVFTTNNTYGLYPPVGGGSLVSFGNNHAAANSGGNGSPTGTAAPF
jgi:hypothetical protein